jgi:hypothetical protein
MREMLRRVIQSLVIALPMMALRLLALLGAASLLGFSAPMLARQAATEPQTKPAGAIVLAAAQPMARIPIQTEVWTEKRTSLAISILKIENPHEASFSIEVFLEPQSNNGATAKPNLASAEIGVLGVYPTGQTGDYRLETSAALRRVQGSGAEANHLCLRLELRRIHPKDSQSGLEVTLSAPRWLPAN